jgi:hypothetical protein
MVLLPASPLLPSNDIVTPRPTLDLSAPEADWPWQESPEDDVDNTAFGGKSPGFCPTGGCRCGRCDRYDYDYEEEYYDEGVGYFSAYVEPVETFADAKARICKTLARYINVLNTVTTGSTKESLLLEMLCFLRDEPYAQDFLDENSKFKNILGVKLTEWGMMATRYDVKDMCGAMIGRFF